jgi:hypothetical protein
MSSIYTKATAKRLIPFSTNIEAIKELKNCIQVTYRVRGSRCSTFLSKLAFLDDFTALRTENAHACVEVCEVHENANCAGRILRPGQVREYLVYSKKSNSYYTVRPNHPDLNKRCECADCHYRGAKCKHQIRVGQFLLQSLKVV